MANPPSPDEEPKKKSCLGEFLARDRKTLAKILITHGLIGFGDVGPDRGPAGRDLFDNPSETASLIEFLRNGQAPIPKRLSAIDELGSESPLAGSDFKIDFGHMAI